jgi:outer membrane protein OmpA-like peptidoglycan-associated protein
MIGARIVGALIVGSVVSSPALMPGRERERPWWERSTVAPPVQVPSGRMTTVIRTPGDVLFDSGSSVVSPDGVAALRSLVPRLRRAVSIEVAGHTDGVGSNSANLALSRARAIAVAAALANLGIAPSAILTTPHGASKPIADESGPDIDQARARNRRVELIVVEMVLVAPHKS